MTEKSISIKELEARTEVLELALLTLLDRFTYAERARFRSKLAESIEAACARPEPVNETDPYHREMRSFGVRFLE